MPTASATLVLPYPTTCAPGLREPHNNGQSNTTKLPVKQY